MLLAAPPRPHRNTGRGRVERCVSAARAQSGWPSASLPSWRAVRMWRYAAEVTANSAHTLGWRYSTGPLVLHQSRVGVWVWRRHGGKDSGADGSRRCAHAERSERRRLRSRRRTCRRSHRRCYGRRRRRRRRRRPWRSVDACLSASWVSMVASSWVDAVGA